MTRGGESCTTVAEQSSTTTTPPPQNQRRRKISSAQTETHIRIEILTSTTTNPPQNQRRRKKQKISSTEIETHIRTETLDPNSTRTSTAQTNRSDFRILKRHGKNKSRSQRKWTYSARDVSNYNDRIVLVSYNILGVENVTKHPQLYREVLPKYLDWEYRKKLLCNEVSRYQPSILCFQEVDRFGDLNDLLRKDGFKGVHKIRSGEACDGCTIFWKSELFTLLHEESIEFQSFGLGNNVAQFCVLKMNQNLPDAGDTAQSTCAMTSRILLVGNIHVLYNPKRGDIKLGQMRIFLEKAYKLSEGWGCIPVVLCGDLNSLPQSAMYQFLASSELHIQQHDRRQISGQIGPSTYTDSKYWSNYRTRPLMHRWTDDEMVLATGSRGGNLRHHLRISSAYAEVTGSSRFRDTVGEPLATSHHSMFTGTVDYIWHTSGLVPVKVLETLPIRRLRKTGGLPSKKWGSDHLALVCELAFADDAD